MNKADKIIFGSILGVFFPFLFALNEKTIGDELQHMLGLNFIPSRGLIVIGILIGGSALIIAQYFLTRIVLVKTLKANSE